MKTTARQQNKTDRRLQRSLMALVAVTGVLWPYMFSIAGSETTFTLTNRTHYFLHANINNQSFVYIAPGGSAIVDVNAPTSVYARVRYSPGQTVKGTSERTVGINATTSYSGGTSTCNNTNQGSTCNSTEPTSSTSATPGRWDVLPTDFTAQ
jgi:hypothetical protein